MKEEALMMMGLVKTQEKPQNLSTEHLQTTGQKTVGPLKLSATYMSP